jgi:hypothetical protein
MTMLFIVSVSAPSLPAFAQVQTRVYVDASSSNVADPSPSNPGSTWTGSTGAYKYLQNGLERARDLLVATPTSLI